MSGPIRVLLADAAPLQRAGLRTMLTSSRPTPPGDSRSTPPGSVSRTALPDEDGRATPAGRVSRAIRPGGDSRAVPPGGHSRADRPERDGWPSRDDPGADSRLSWIDPSGGDGSAAGDGWLGGREIIVAGEAGDGVEAVDLARRLLPDVLITDVTLPRLDGLAVARAVTEARLDVRVLLLTGRDTDEEVITAVAAGAAGYLCKDAPQAELVAAVRAVADGGAVITPHVLARMLTRLSGTLSAGPGHDATARLSPLTGREREVLVHVARGRSNSEIAALLGVSETTVKTHVGHVLTKLRLRDRTQAVVLAYETGLVRPGG